MEDARGSVLCELPRQRFGPMSWSVIANFALDINFAFVKVGSEPTFFGRCFAFAQPLLQRSPVAVGRGQKRGGRGLQFLPKHSIAIFTTDDRTRQRTEIVEDFRWRLRWRHIEVDRRRRVWWQEVGPPFQVIEGTARGIEPRPFFFSFFPVEG